MSWENPIILRFSKTHGEFMPTVMITGSSRGLGAAIKMNFVERGYNCISPNRDQLDLLSGESVRRFIGELDENVDVLVNNAGINLKSPLDEISDDKIEAMVATNLVAPLKLMQAVMRGMAESGGGKVVNIGSIWGVRSLEHRTLYSMTKFGLDGMTRALAREFGPHNVLLNTVAPGFMGTEMTYQNLSQVEQGELTAQIPLRRFADPSELAELVYFLSSPQNTYITGQTIVADGGYLA